MVEVVMEGKILRMATFWQSSGCTWPEVAVVMLVEVQVMLKSLDHLETEEGGGLEDGLVVQGDLYPHLGGALHRGRGLGNFPSREGSTQQASIFC